MSEFFISQPGPSEPEYVHAAYRFAVQCWNNEKEAVLILDGISGPPVFANPIVIKRAQEAVAHAEDRTCNAVELLVDAIRRARRPSHQTALIA